MKYAQYLPRYKPLYLWLLTTGTGLKAVVLADDSDEAQQLAAEYAPSWRSATCEKIARVRVTRKHYVLALEKPDAQ